MDNRGLVVLMEKLADNQCAAGGGRHFIFFLAEVDWELMLSKK